MEPRQGAWRSHACGTGSLRPIITLTSAGPLGFVAGLRQRPELGLDLRVGVLEVVASCRRGRAGAAPGGGSPPWS